MIALVAGFDGYSQGVLLVKKRGHSVRHYWEGSTITLQLQDRQWLMGTILRISSDSIYLTQLIIRYNMTGIDTLRTGQLGFSFEDIYALPSKHELVYFQNDQVRIIPGHEKFIWVRNGFIFQVAGASYAGLSITNDLINNDPPFTRKRLPGLGIGAGLFLLGRWLKGQYDPYWHLGKKYKLEYLSLNPTAQPGPPHNNKSY
jgi:hypothetical protein